MIESAFIPTDRAEGPGYEEPWQAQAFACAMQLSRAGLFTRSEWAEALGREIRLHPARDGERPVAAYYRQVLDALDRLIREKGAISSAELATRIEAWRQAYLNTPHGQAVELRNACSAPASEHAHHHEAVRRPIAVSPPRR
jgi:nitrile hydratase accessory protein